MFSRYFIFVFVLSYIFFQSLSGKDRVLVILENAQNWLEQPSVGKDGRIQTDLYGKGLSYTVRSASSASSLIRITAMQVAQFPRAGQAFNVTLGFRNDQTVTDTIRANVTAKLRGHEVYRSTHIICSDVLPLYTSATCPIGPGEHKITATIVLPDDIPRARYEVTVKLWDATTERTNELVLDANFLFHGTWLEVYENSLEFLKMYARRLAVVASNGLVGRQPKPKASSRARKAANRRVDL